MRVNRVFSTGIEILIDEIASTATSTEDAQAIAQKKIQRLAETNWAHVIADKKARAEAEALQRHEQFLNSPRSCKRCNKKFKYREMQSAKVAWDVGLYCVTCFDHFKREHTYTCQLCNAVYLSRRRSKYCSLCKIKDEKKEALVVQRHRCDAKKAGRPATLTLKQWLGTLQYFAGNCAYCQQQSYEVLEHFIPINPGKEFGGGTTVGNCVPACESCNRKKKNALPDEILGYAIAKNITHTNSYRNGIDIKDIQRVWMYLDGLRHSPIPGGSFEERKQFYQQTMTEWWNEQLPEIRKRVEKILSGE